MPIADAHTHVRYPAAQKTVEQNDMPETIILRRYRVMGSCGTGGFGTVLACWDTRLQRRVAIKRMRLAPLINQTAQIPGATIAQADATIEEALSEARTASRLEHPGIVAVHDFAIENQIAYLVMEYVDGMTLSELLSRVEGGTLTHDEVAYLAQELGAALAFAHHAGVLHLDIKPSNIMLTHEGKIKLCDFGMAALSSAAGFADARGGTVGYMPPEQIEGGTVDERADIFSMVVVLVQALTGTNPFAADTAEQSALAIRRGIRPRLSKKNPTLAGITEQTIMACLDADPALRPTNADQVADDMAFGLGDPEEGAASISSLTSQEDGLDDDEWEGERIPLAVRFPWLASAVVRGLTAIAASLLTAELLPHIPLTQSVPIVPGVLAVAAAVACWTPLAGLLIPLLFALALLPAGNGPSILLAVTIIACFGTLWFKQIHTQTASLALLVAPALGQNAAAAAVAGCNSDVPRAAISAGFAWLLTQLKLLLIPVGFQLAKASTKLPLLISFPSLIRLGGCILAACLASIIGRPEASRTRFIIGQISCCGIVCFSQLVAARMENGGIWPAPTWETVGVAVLLTIFVSLISALQESRHFEDEESK